MGGTSVWYHVHTGRKVFFFIRPTPANLQAYAQWTKAKTQADVFFADLVPFCYRVELSAGNTMFIPSGVWYILY